MGQSISKKVMPTINKAIQSHERVMAKDALDDIARKQAHASASNTKYTDPGALQGFKRDEWKPSESLPSEMGQKNFLNEINANSDGSVNKSPQEMPDDLLKFLTDAGPLKRSIDKELTSPKVYESLLEEEEVKKQENQQKNQRRRRIMSMVGDEEIGDLDASNDSRSRTLDGTTVSRTTNFSTATRNGDDNDIDITLEDIELFQLLAKLQAKSQSQSHSNENSTTPEQFVQSQMKSELENENLQKDNIALVEHMTNYTTIPILMQDTDKSFVGAWSDPDSLDALKLQGVRMAPSHVKLLFQHEIEAQQGLHSGPNIVQQEQEKVQVQGKERSQKDYSRESEVETDTGRNTDSSTSISGSGNTGMSTAEFLRKARKEAQSKE